MHLSLRVIINVVRGARHNLFLAWGLTQAKTGLDDNGSNLPQC